MESLGRGVVCCLGGVSLCRVFLGVMLCLLESVQHEEGSENWLTGRDGVLFGMSA